MNFLKENLQTKKQRIIFVLSLLIAYPLITIPYYLNLFDGGKWGHEVSFIASCVTMSLFMSFATLITILFAIFCGISIIQWINKGI